MANLALPVEHFDTREPDLAGAAAVLGVANRVARDANALTLALVLGQDF